MLEGEAKAGGDRQSIIQSLNNGWTLKKTAELAGISVGATYKAIKIATLVEEHPEYAGLKGEQIIRKDSIAHQIEAINQLAPVEGVYDVIVIDPPWQIAGDYDPDGRRSANPYPAMDFEEIANIQLPTSDNCVLWLWVTNLNIHDGFHLLDKWGFEYKNMLTWAKDKFGLGVWLRGQVG